jgi:hypothetical protein
MPNSPKRRLLRSDAMVDSADLGKLLYDTYEGGPGRPVPEAFLDLLAKPDAERAELEKKQDG